MSNMNYSLILICCILSFVGTCELGMLDGCNQAAAVNNSQSCVRRSRGVIS